MSGEMKTKTKFYAAKNRPTPTAPASPAPARCMRDAPLFWPPLPEELDEAVKFGTSLPADLQVSA